MALVYQTRILRNQFQIFGQRCFAHCSHDRKDAEIAKNKKCPINESCVKAPPRKKRTFWERFFACDNKEHEMAERPPIETCRKQYVKPRCDPDLSFIPGGQVFRTCGEAYIVQKDLLPTKPAAATSREHKTVRIIEQPLHETLSPYEDPLDRITSVEQRMIELTDLKLHPNYKQMDSIPKRPPPNCPAPCTPTRNYNIISGPLDPNDIPVQIKFNRTLLDKKNIMCDFKRVEPPRAMLAPIMEMTLNQRPTLERKVGGGGGGGGGGQQTTTSDKQRLSDDHRHCRIETESKVSASDTLIQPTTLLDTIVFVAGRDRKCAGGDGNKGDGKKDQ